MNLYSGPATKVEIDTVLAMTSAVDLGEASNIEINWEPIGKTLMDGSKTQNGGNGTLSIRLDEGGSTVNTKLKAKRNTRCFVRITLASADTVIVKNILLNYGYNAPFSNPEESIGWPLSAEQWTDEPDDFCSVIAD